MMTDTERNEMVDMVAQAVIDKMEQREQTNAIAELVVRRVLALQEEEAKLKATETEKETTNAGNQQQQ